MNSFKKLEQMLDEVTPPKNTLEKSRFEQELNKLDIENLFSYHAPRTDQIPRYDVLRNAAKTFAKIIVALTPQCSDQITAIQKLRECVMTANASIACNEGNIQEATR